LLALLVLAARYLIEQRRVNRYRREALAVLKTIEGERDLNPAESAQRIAALLKRTALAAYPRQQVASLTGSDWARFLKESTRNDQQVADAAEMLAAAAYRPDADGRELSAPARRWIRLHRA
jgi:Ca-activated chloride channel family protein